MPQYFKNILFSVTNLCSSRSFTIAAVLHSKATQKFTVTGRRALSCFFKAQCGQRTHGENLYLPFALVQGL